MRLTDRRHDLRTEVEPDVFPMFRVIEMGGEIGIGIHAEVTFAGAVAVAVETVFDKNGLNLLFEFLVSDEWREKREGGADDGDYFFQGQAMDT